jgi:hypothetical protein
MHDSNMRKMPRRPWITSIHDGMEADQYIVSSVQSQISRRLVVANMSHVIVIEEDTVISCMQSDHRHDCYATWRPLKRSISKNTARTTDQIANRRRPIEIVEDRGNSFNSTHDSTFFLGPAPDPVVPLHGSQLLDASSVTVVGLLCLGPAPDPAVLLHRSLLAKNVTFDYKSKVDMIFTFERALNLRSASWNLITPISFLQVRLVFDASLF